MTAATTTRSAYPKTVDELIPHARDLAADLGEVPSRNKVMKTFRVGSDKAKALIDALTEPPTIEAPAEAPAPLPDLPSEPDEVPAPIPAVAPLAAAPAPLAPAVVLPPPVAPARTTPALLTAQLLGRWRRRAPRAMPAPAAAVIAPTVPDRRAVTWPVFLLCLPAFVAIWGGWVEMGRLTGFGMVKLLPGIADSIELNTAITLPIGVETYAAYALFVWLSGRAAGDARRFAKWSALGSLGLGALGQIAYHLMNAWGWTEAPWPITAAVACIPVAVLGMGAALAHLMHKSN